MARALPPPNVPGLGFAFIDGAGAIRQSVFGSLACRARVKLVLISIAAHLREIISWSWLSPVISSVFSHCFCAASPRYLYAADTAGVVNRALVGRTSRSQSEPPAFQIYGSVLAVFLMGWHWDQAFGILALMASLVLRRSAQVCGG